MAIGGVAATPTSHARIGAGGISGLLADRWIRLTALLGLAWLIAYAAAKAPIESERATLVLSDLVYLGPGAAATLACLVAARRARRRQRVFWRLLAASNLCIFSGAVVWATLELGLGRDSFPSLADVFYLCGYAAALAAALFGLGGGLSRRLWRGILDASVLVAALGVTGPPTRTSASPAPTPAARGSTSAGTPRLC